MVVYVAEVRNPFVVSLRYDEEIGPLSPLAVSLAAGFSGSVAAAASHGFDTAKSRSQCTVLPKVFLLLGITLPLMTALACWLCSSSLTFAVSFPYNQLLCKVFLFSYLLIYLLRYFSCFYSVVCTLYCTRNSIYCDFLVVM